MLEEGRRFGPAGDVSLAIERAYPRGHPEFPPGGYLLRVVLDSGQVVVGTMILRVFPDPRVEAFIGHLGYEIEPDHRGRGYATPAARLLGPLARHHGLECRVNPRVCGVTCPGLASRVVGGSRVPRLG